jgi:hypothetical protein
LGDPTVAPNNSLVVGKDAWGEVDAKELQFMLIRVREVFLKPPGEVCKLDPACTKTVPTILQV